MTDARNFLIDSDFPLDKLVVVKQSSFSVPDTGFGAVDITLHTHNFGYTPLPMLLWSNQSNFQLTYTFFDADPNFILGFQLYDVSADPTKISVRCTNTTGSTKIVYYKLFAYPPSNIGLGTAPATATLGSNLQLDTDFNYLKLMKADRLTVASPVFSHNLGYVPTVLVWACLNSGGVTQAFMNSDMSWAYDASTGQEDFSGLAVNTSSIRWLNPAMFDYYEYRLYMDD